MQLAQIAPHASSLPPSVGPVSPGRALSAAPPRQVAGVTAAVGAPIVDFPGISAGDEFDVAKGSKVGPIPVRGQARIERFDPDHATFWIAGGRFGFQVDVQVDIVQVEGGLVRISARGEGIPDVSELARVVEQQTNRAVFEQVSDPARRTLITHDGAGRIVIDTVIPTLGDAHLRLQRRGSPGAGIGPLAPLAAPSSAAPVPGTA